MVFQISVQSTACLFEGVNLLNEIHWLHKVVWRVLIVCCHRISHTVDEGQTSKLRTNYRGIIHATVSITREEGLLALYRVRNLTSHRHMKCLCINCRRL